MKKINIKGTEYVPVNERVLHFWEIHPEYSITTEILSELPDRVIVIAKITDGNGILRATGHAYEKEGNGFINKHHHIENAETSAVGRALGMLGIGIDTSIASFEEVANSNLQDGTPITEKQKTIIENLVENSQLPEEILLRIEQSYLGYTSNRAAECITYLMDNKKKNIDEQFKDLEI